MPSFAAAGSIRCFPGPPRSLADIACMHARSLCDAVPSLMIRASRPAGRLQFKPQLAEEEDEEGRGGEEG
uniref:Uncharacterized protein n=1 Tax=Oryza nivara TaxID=4536 RepID=A0A0E0FIK8_ORYNI